MAVWERTRSIASISEQQDSKETPSLTTQSSDIWTSLLSVPGRQGLDSKRRIISSSSHVCTNDLTTENTKSASDRGQMKYKHTVISGGLVRDGCHNQNTTSKT